MYNKSIFWFRQDLRTHDNSWLIEAIHNSKEILPVFILDENIIPKFGGLTDKKFWFIREALEYLSNEIKKLWGDKVIVFHWKPEEIIPKLVKKYEIECIYANNSYWNYGKNRDSKVAELSGCHFEIHKDFLLAEPHEIEQRKVFTPFYKLWQKYLIETYTPPAHWCSLPPQLRGTEGEFKQLTTEEQSEASDFIELERHPYFTMQFGQERFAKLPMQNYNNLRNNLDIDRTSRLSPYLRFGIFSVREIFWKTLNNSSPSPSFDIKGGEHISHLSFRMKGEDSGEEYLQLPPKWTHEESYISELAWREFWWHIYYYFPHTKELEFQEKRRHITWSEDQEIFAKWCRWETWYPVVDAAMRQLNETNWMHGRARMIVASFLTKDLNIDWRLGETYFREKLLDYDEAVNLWNWQWGASVWADPKPLRIFSPLLQSEKFDPEAKYIRKYIPDLSNTELKHIHDPIIHKLEYASLIVNHKEAQAKTKEIYKQSSLDHENIKKSS